MSREQPSSPARAAAGVGPADGVRRPSHVVVAYLTAFTSGDIGTARSLLAEDFSFQGPRGGAEGRDSFLAAATWVLPHLSGFRMLRQWEDGDEVCSMYEFELNTPMGPKALVMADWSTVRHGQLASALVVFDAAAAQQALTPPPPAAAESR